MLKTNSINFTHKQCPICSVNNLADVILFNEFEVREFINDVYTGVVNTNKLSLKIYNVVASEFSKHVDNGWGILPNVVLSDKDYDIYFGLIESVFVFSAAKQYQCVRELEELKTDKDYYNKALEVFNKYYINYLAIELEMCEIQGGAVKKWIELENAES